MIRIQRRLRIEFPIATGVMLHTACTAESASCGAIALALPEIVVTDAATGQPICDATVEARCNDAGVELVAFGPHGYKVDSAVPGCKYGPGLQTVSACNVFTVTISKPGYKPVVLLDVEVRHSMSCPGPIPDPQKIDVPLEAG